MVTQNKELEIRYFMNKKTKRLNDTASAAFRANSLLKPYNVKGYLPALPDFCDSNSLPVGTSLTLEVNQLLDPHLIGIDIGYGYQFASLDINPKRYYKKGKLKVN